MMSGRGETGAASDTRAGYVALVGRPNVGKSTLLNAFIGEKLSIVTPRAQTTRERVLGIYTTERVQVIFVDTPGILEPRYLLQQSMLESALAALADADLILLILDALQAEGTVPEGDVLDRLRARSAAVFVAVNKVDAATPEDVDRLAGWSSEHFSRAPFRVAATTGEGVEPLRDALVDALPESPFFYPADEIATQPVRFFVAELVRETIFEQYREEIPYSTVVRIDQFREAETPLLIRATIFVERESQKGILIGSRGSAIKRLGERARGKIEAFVRRHVYLDLWVKVMPRWRKKRKSLEQLGYRPPSGEPTGG